MQCLFSACLCNAISMHSFSAALLPVQSSSVPVLCIAIQFQCRSGQSRTVLIHSESMQFHGGAYHLSSFPCLSIAERFSAFPSHGSVLPFRTSPLLIGARPRSAMPFQLVASLCFSIALPPWACPCHHAAVPIASMPCLHNAWPRTAPLFHCFAPRRRPYPSLEGEDYSSRSSSSSQVKRPFPLFRHCPKPRSRP